MFHLTFLGGSLLKVFHRRWCAHHLGAKEPDPTASESAGANESPLREASQPSPVATTTTTSTSTSRSSSGTGDADGSPGGNASTGCEAESAAQRSPRWRCCTSTTVNNTDWLVPDTYTDLRLIGSGAYGQVCAALNRKTGETVAIKKLYRPLDSELLSKRAHREMQLLMHLRSSQSNVIRLLDVFTPNDSEGTFKDIYLAMEYMPTDLHRLIAAQTLAPPVYQIITYQVLRGLDYIHSAGVLHRDLKPKNIAINEGLVVKILDFGLARIKCTNSEDSMTGYVATRWYRAPEVMLKWEHYGNSGKVDVWSVGCILAEMMTRDVLFKGGSEMDQVTLMVQMLGIPSESMLQSVDPSVRFFFERQPKVAVQPLEEYFPGVGRQALDLLSSLLKLDHKYRFSTKEGLTHPFFRDIFDPADVVTAEEVQTTSVDNEVLTLEMWKSELFKEVNAAGCLLAGEQALSSTGDSDVPCE